jgi:hypothetical protein
VPRRAVPSTAAAAPTTRRRSPTPRRRRRSRRDRPAPSTTSAIPRSTPPTTGASCWSADDRAELLRELDEPLDLGEGDVRTHELIVVERITGATNVPDGTWLLTASGAVHPAGRARQGLGEADLTLASMPSPDARTLEVLVHERACASGRRRRGASSW